MEIVGKQMLNMLTDYRAFDKVYEREENEDWDIYDVEEVMLQAKWELYFGNHGTWVDCWRTMPDDPTDDEFVFYIARYLTPYYNNVSKALKEALEIVWLDDEGMNYFMRHKKGDLCRPRREYKLTGKEK